MAKEFVRKITGVNTIQETRDWTNNIGDILVKNNRYAYIRTYGEYKPISYPMIWDYPGLPDKQVSKSDHNVDESGVHGSDTKVNTNRKYDLTDGQISTVDKTDNTSFSSVQDNEGYYKNYTDFALHNFMIDKFTQQAYDYNGRINVDYSKNPNEFLESFIHIDKTQAFEGVEYYVDTSDDNANSAKLVVFPDEAYVSSNYKKSFIELHSYPYSSQLRFLDNDLHENVILSFNDQSGTINFGISGTPNGINTFRTAFDNLLGVTAKYQEVLQKLSEDNSNLQNQITSLENRVTTLEHR